ncbi:hypothetical protein N7476_004834 [Penicillium atrosanguineum]|uniref:Uncharacterized protein n=1 Tax=Penicillium atrosanguineum TaxID=1132637 RepID=A0A9W9U4X2_9EURO|nr:hypothetical protein N7526_001866 [Penicillium atrosanguineum]KAJ5318414.1 hypothetical protein N7476_004834 [Penicillium atrosanguineum]
MKACEGPYIQPPTQHTRIEVSSLLNHPTDDEQVPPIVSYAQHVSVIPPSHGHSPPIRDSCLSRLEQFQQGRYSASPDNKIGAASATPVMVQEGGISLTVQHSHQNSISRRLSKPADFSQNLCPSQKRSDWSETGLHAERAQRRGSHREEYEEEEMHFIWYHRVDLRWQWKWIREKFNREFSSHKPRSFQGLQCKFYRFIKGMKSHTSREQYPVHNSKPQNDGACFGNDIHSPHLNLDEWAKLWYPGVHKSRQELLQKPNSSPSKSNLAFVTR